MWFFIVWNQKIRRLQRPTAISQMHNQCHDHNHKNCDYAYVLLSHAHALAFALSRRSRQALYMHHRLLSGFMIIAIKIHLGHCYRLAYAGQAHLPDGKSFESVRRYSLWGLRVQGLGAGGENTTSESVLGTHEATRKACKQAIAAIIHNDCNERQGRSQSRQGWGVSWSQQWSPALALRLAVPQCYKIRVRELSWWSHRCWSWVCHQRMHLHRVLSNQAQAKFWKLNSVVAANIYMDIHGIAADWKCMDGLHHTRWKLILPHGGSQTKNYLNNSFLTSAPR